MTSLPGPWRLALALLATIVLPGCASLTAISEDEAFERPPPAIELTGVPYFPQDDYQCGPAALAEMLGWSGEQVTPEELAPSLFIPERKGTLQTELIAQTRQRDRVPYRIAGEFDAIIAELEAGNPVMVFQNLSLAWYPVWHFAVVVGYDPERGGFILRSGREKRVFTKLDTFRRSWDRGERWAIVVTRPHRLPASAEPLPWLEAAADLEQTGRREASEAAYHAGVARWPDQAGFHLGLVNIRHASGDLPGAEAAARRGLRQASGNHGVLNNNLALILAQQFRWDEAEQAAEAAVAAGGRFEADFATTLERVRCRGEASCLAALEHGN
ncbi:MAG: PA2778 family cysteine peptidase [Aquisalimonadaceae bacterium]